ncbi:YqcI/YcgG family protein [Rossellomorea aquimaris]|uniref:YqcI/YcgG family protein n=1 Tax=Rossellomorea aquimaris TaxID=189382 RepID=A0A5D4U710_9BACI|nr:YqcI/YcgG family protein [Rossellomorea aquimaris]TYS82920.1 YqcI/YcgG family protein [Rossellomorea aquimaris]
MVLYQEGGPETEGLCPWQKDAISLFAEKMTSNKKFPCIPATQAYGLKHLRYGFAGFPGSESTGIELAEILKQYSIKSRNFGKYTTLVVFFDTPAALIETNTVEDFEFLFWKLLNQLNEQDELDWPAHIPTDPENSHWEFCFHGEQYFMYCASPLHKNRDSRCFPYMMMAITPRWVLKEFNSNSGYAEKIQKQIRKRLHQYDAIEAHPELKKYGSEDNYEWKQYFLRDDDSALSKCPFHGMLKASKDK